MKEKFSEHYKKTCQTKTSFAKKYSCGMENKYMSARVFEKKPLSTFELALLPPEYLVVP